MALMNPADIGNRRLPNAAGRLRRLRRRRMANRGSEVEQSGGLLPKWRQGRRATSTVMSADLHDFRDAAGRRQYIERSDSALTARCQSSRQSRRSIAS
jgi:hypothetical protein